MPAHAKDQPQKHTQIITKLNSMMRSLQNPPPDPPKKA
jgi:hypothetical protein